MRAMTVMEDRVAHRQPLCNNPTNQCLTRYIVSNTPRAFIRLVGNRQNNEKLKHSKDTNVSSAILNLNFFQPQINPLLINRILINDRKYYQRLTLVNPIKFVQRPLLIAYNNSAVNPLIIQFEALQKLTKFPIKITVSSCFQPSGCEL